MDNGGGRRRRHRSWLSESRSRHGVLLQPVGQEDRRLLLRKGPHMRVHLVNPSDVSFGTAVITPRWLYVLAAATPPSTARPSIVDETLEPFDVDGSPAATSWGLAFTPPTRFADTRSARSRAQGRVRRLRRHSRHAVSGRSPRARRGACRGHRRWRSCLAAVLADCAQRGARSVSTTAAGSRARRSRPRAGTCCRPIATCGARCRRCAAVRSIARSARCGAPTGRSRASGRWPRSSAKSSRSGARDSDSSCSRTTTSIP